MQHFGQVLRLIRNVAATAIVGTGLVAFGLGLYLGKGLGELRNQGSGGTSGGRTSRDQQAPKQAPPSSPSELSLKANSVSVDVRFLTQLTDAVFHAQRPELQGRPLSGANTSAERRLRQEWWQTMDDVADRLEQFDLPIRQALGSCGQRNYYQLIGQAADAGMRKDRFQDIVNTRLDRLFPSLENSNFIDPASGESTPKFQLWCAIAQDAL